MKVRFSAGRKDQWCLGEVKTEPVSFRVECEAWSWPSLALMVRHTSDYTLNELSPYRFQAIRLSRSHPPLRIRPLSLSSSHFKVGMDDTQMSTLHCQAEEASQNNTSGLMLVNKLRKRCIVQDKHIQSHLVNHLSYHSAKLHIASMIHPFFDTYTIADATTSIPTGNMGENDHLQPRNSARSPCTLQL
jgi:hypothetical protein